MRDIRVLLVTGSFPPMPCGVGDYTEALAGAMAACEHVRVGVLTSTAADPHLGAKYEVFPAVHDWTLPERPAVMKVVRDWEPDLVHIQYPTQGYRGRLPVRLPMLLRMQGIPVVQTWHEHVPAKGAILDLALVTLRDLPQVSFGRDVIVVRHDFEARLPWWYRVLAPRRRYHLIPNGPSLPRARLDPGERASIRERFVAGDKRLLVYFGFCYEHKGIDDALAAMDPNLHHLVIAGAVLESDPYQANLLRRVREAPLAGHVTVTGFLSGEDAARLLAAADAVVLPFRTGGGTWNTSLKAAALQGSFVLTTSTERHGFDAAANVYWARPRDPVDLAYALRAHIGQRLEDPSPELAGPSWPEIARRHVDVYRLSL